MPQRKDATGNLVNKASESKASESKVSRSKISPTNPFVQKFFALIGFPDMSPVYSGQRINNELPEIVVFLIMWHTKASILRALQVALGVLATFFSLLTTTLISINEPNSKLFAFIAAISVAMLAAFDLGTKSNNVTNAWRNLNSVVMQYNNYLCENADVIKAYREGEQLIGNVSYQSTK